LRLCGEGFNSVGSVISVVRSFLNLSAFSAISAVNRFYLCVLRELCGGFLIKNLRVLCDLCGEKVFLSVVSRF